MDAFHLFFVQISINLSDNISWPDLLARSFIRFLARVLTRVLGRGKTMHAVYSTFPGLKDKTLNNNIKSAKQPVQNQLISSRSGLVHADSQGGMEHCALGAAGRILETSKRAHNLNVLDDAPAERAQNVSRSTD